MSADEIDAELLALAGDDSDEDVESVEETQPTEAKSPLQEPKASVEKTEAATQTRRGVAQKVRKRGRKKATRRELEDELDDLRDDSPSPAASIGSGDMDQSDSEADTPAIGEVDEGPLYPLEGRFMSSSDREHILSLPEIEREEILAERAQEVLKRQQDMQLRKALAAAQAASKNKRKAAVAQLDEESTRKSRPKTEKRSALDDYKKAREAKGTERSSRISHRNDRRDSRSASLASERDADGESEVEWAEPSSLGRRERDEPLADLKDFERCRVGRSNFAKVCFYPNFETAIQGCFCRISIGMNRETGQNMYRMTQIKGFTEGKPYNVETTNGPHFMTDQYALVAHGNAEKPWPFSACSDSKFTELEFQRYKDTLEKEHLRFPRKSTLSQKLDNIHQFLHPQWDEQTLQAKLTRQKAMKAKLDPSNQLKRKQDAILKRKADAEEAEDTEEIARCDAELEALQSNSTNGANGAHDSEAAANKLSPAKSKGTQQERLAYLNQKNRDMNAMLVRKALIDERRKLQRDRAKALEAAQAKTAAEAEAKRQADLLAVPARGELNDLFGDTPTLSRAGTPVSGIGTPKRVRSRQGTPLAGAKTDNLPRSGIGLVIGKKRMEEEDEFADLDIGIDVEI